VNVGATRRGADRPTSACPSQVVRHGEPFSHPLLLLLQFGQLHRPEFDGLLCDRCRL